MTNNKRSGGKGFGLKVYAAITSLLLVVAVTVTAVGFGTGWWQVRESEETPIEQTEQENSVIVNEVESNGISLMSASGSDSVGSAREGAQRITATITPANATNKAVDWELSWVNPSSEWATGKTVTDYVTITPTSDGALTADLECSEAFGEQVKLTVTSRQNPEASATATIDYAKRISGFTTTRKGDVTTSIHYGLVLTEVNSYNYHATDELENIYFDLTSFDWSTNTGTVDDDFTYEYTVTFSSEWLDALETSFSSYIVGNSITIAGSQQFQVGTVMGIDALNSVAQEFIYEDMTSNTNGAFTEFIDALRSMDGKTIMTLTATATGTYSTTTATINYRYDATDLSVSVNDVTLSDDSFIL